MLSGKLPFAGKNLPELLNAIRHEQPVPLSSHVPEVPAHVVAAIERAMAKEKSQRFESIQDFIGRGLAGFLQKPYTLNALRETLQRCARPGGR